MRCPAVDCCLTPMPGVPARCQPSIGTKSRTGCATLWVSSGTKLGKPLTRAVHGMRSLTPCARLLRRSGGLPRSRTGASFCRICGRGGTCTAIASRRRSPTASKPREPADNCTFMPDALPAWPGRQCGELSWRPRGGAALQSLHVDRIINCTGPETDITKARDPLFQSLLRTGMARPDPLGLGFDVTEEGAFRGNASDRLFGIGPICRSAQWEITAVPDIRAQCESLAQRISELAPAPGRCRLDPTRRAGIACGCPPAILASELRARCLLVVPRVSCQVLAQHQTARRFELRGRQSHVGLVGQPVRFM